MLHRRARCRDRCITDEYSMAIQVRLSRVLCLVDSAPFLHGFKASADRARQHSTAAAVSPTTERKQTNKHSNKQTNKQTNKNGHWAAAGSRWLRCGRTPRESARAAADGTRLHAMHRRAFQHAVRATCGGRVRASCRPPCNGAPNLDAACCSRMLAAHGAGWCACARRGRRVFHAGWRMMNLRHDMRRRVRTMQAAHGYGSWHARAQGQSDPQPLMTLLYDQVEAADLIARRPPARGRKVAQAAQGMLQAGWCMQHAACDTPRGARCTLDAPCSPSAQQGRGRQR